MSQSVNSNSTMESTEKVHFRESLLFFLTQEARSKSISLESSPSLRRHPAAEGLQIFIDNNHDHDIEHGIAEEDDDDEHDHSRPIDGEDMQREETFSMLPTVSEMSTDSVTAANKSQHHIISSTTSSPSVKVKRFIANSRRSSKDNTNNNLATIVSFRIDDWEIEAKRTTPTSTSSTNRRISNTNASSQFLTSTGSRKQSIHNKKEMLSKMSMMSLRDIPLYNVSYDAVETPRHANKHKKKPPTEPKEREIWQSALSYQSMPNHNQSSYYYHRNPEIESKKSFYKGSAFRKRSRSDLLPTLEKQMAKLLPLSSSSKGEYPSKSFIYEFDYVIVFPLAANMQNGQTTDAKYIMHTMLLAGLEIYPYLSARKDSLFVLIRCPVDTLKAIAEKSGYKLLCDPAVLEEVLAQGNPSKRIAPTRIKHDPKITPIKPYEYVYLKYQAENDKSLYITPPNEDSSFIKSVRLKLIYTLFTAPKRIGGCNLEISSLIHQKKILSLFPLHDTDECHQILQKCTAWDVLPWNTPVEELKNYLGEKISLFNVFLGHLSIWLVPIAIIGIAAQIVVLVTLNFSSNVLPIYSAVIILWSIIMIATWKRKQSLTALRWGMSDFVSQQFERPEFFGVLHANSFIDGREMLYFSRKDYRRRIMLSLATIFSIVLLVIGVISAIYILKITLQGNLGLWVSGITSLLNVGQILIFNLIYQQVAVRLTHQENHRTDTEFENALILKVFVFQFINSYASLFFLAFIAPSLPRPSYLSDVGEEANYVGQCGAESCMKPLAINLGVIIGARMVFKNVMDVVIPYVNYLYTIRTQTKSFTIDRHLTPPELDYMLMEYDPILENVRKYADLAVQYGYTILFAASLPLAPIMTLLYNYLKVKFQAWKLLMLYKRPIPVGAQSIESWQLIFTFISIIAVPTNAAIISFTMDTLKDRTFSFRVWVFIGFQWMMFTLQYVTSLMIPEEPERVHIQKSRISAISQKLIEKFEDDDYDKYVDYASDDEMEEKDASKDEEEDHRNKGESNDFARFDASKSSIDCDPQQSMDPESMDPDNDTSDKNNNSGLKRANKGFYQPQLESKQSGWWNSISESFWLPSGERPQSNRRSLSLRFRKQKAYRTRVHHTVSDAIHLSPLAMFDYPYSESVKHWTPPLTKDEVGRESELDILDLDI